MLAGCDEQGLETAETPSDTTPETADSDGLQDARDASRDEGDVDLALDTFDVVDQDAVTDDVPVWPLPDEDPIVPGECPDGALAETHGWCWHTPLPHGYGLSDIVSPAPGALWAITEGGLLHRDERGWHLVHNDELGELAVGPKPEFRDAWPLGRALVALSARRVVTRTRYDDGVVLLHGPESRSRALPTPCGPDFVFSVADDAHWLVCETYQGDDDPTRVLLMTDEGVVDRTPPADLTPKDDLEVRAIWARSAEHLWLAIDGYLLTYDSGQWSVARLEIGDPTRDIRIAAMTGVGRDALIMTRPRRILHWRDGEILAEIEMPPRDRDAASDRLELEADGPNDIWVLDGDLHHYDGWSWAKVADDDLGEMYLDVRPHAVHITAGGALYEIRDGALVAQTPEAHRWTDVWASRDGRATAIGKRGLVAHWNGESWRIERAGGGANLSVVDGATHDSLWALAEDRTLFHREGGRWVEVDHGIPAGHELRDVAYDPTADEHQLWIVSRLALIRWRSADDWDAEFDVTEHAKDPQQVAVTPAGAVWVAGEDDVVRFDEGRFEALPEPPSGPGLPGLAELWADDGEAWFGLHRSILRWNGTSWSLLETRSYRDLLALSGHAEDVWLGYDGGLAQRVVDAGRQSVNLPTGSDLVAIDAHRAGAWFAASSGELWDVRRDRSFERHVLGLPHPLPFEWSGLNSARLWRHFMVGSNTIWTFSGSGGWSRAEAGAWVDRGSFPDRGRGSVLALGGPAEAPIVLTSDGRYQFGGTRWHLLGRYERSRPYPSIFGDDDGVLDGAIDAADLLDVDHFAIAGHRSEAPCDGLCVAVHDPAGWSHMPVEASELAEDIVQIELTGPRSGWLLTDGNVLFHADGNVWGPVDRVAGGGQRPRPVDIVCVGWHRALRADAIALRPR